MKRVNEKNSRQYSAGCAQFSNKSVKIGEGKLPNNFLVHDPVPYLRNTSNNF